MNKIKQLSFEGKVIYCGLDVHKTNWKINARMEGIEMAALFICQVLYSASASVPIFSRKPKLSTSERIVTIFP